MNITDLKCAFKHCYSILTTKKKSILHPRWHILIHSFTHSQIFIVSYKMPATMLSALGQGRRKLPYKHKLKEFTTKSLL